MQHRHLGVVVSEEASREDGAEEGVVTQVDHLMHSERQKVQQFLLEVCTLSP